MEDTEIESKKLVRLPRLLLGIITLLFAGIIYSWSILKAPLADTFGWSASELAFNFTLTMCFFCIGGLLSGLLVKKLSVFVRMLIGAIFVLIGFLTVAYLKADNVVILYLT